MPDNRSGLEAPATQTRGAVQAAGPQAGELFRASALMVMIAAGSCVCLLLARPFISPLAWAAALAVVLAPTYRWLLRRLSGWS